MHSNFRDLNAYKLSVALGHDMYGAVKTWPATDRYEIGQQLVRAVNSIGANIAESAGRWHAGEKRQFFIVARGSLYEAEHWLVTAEARGLVEPDTVDRLGDIARALSGLIKKPAPEAHPADCRPRT